MSSDFQVQVDQGNALDELTQLLDCDSFEEDSNQGHSTETKEPLPLINESNKSNQGNDLDELTQLLDCDSFEEDSNQEHLTESKQPLPVTNESNKSNTTNKVSTFEHIKNSNSEKRSEIHGGDTDSSDDEDNRYAGDHQNYSDSGRTIKSFLKKNSSSDIYIDSKSSWKRMKVSSPQSQQNKTPVSTVKTPTDIYSDPFFGIRIITPLVSSQSIREKMLGKKAVTFKRLEKHLATYDKSSDWVLAGAILSKTIRTSQKGNPYACWTLSDLAQELKTVTLFLFGKAYKDLWKTNTHTVVAILNPSPLDNNSKENIAKLSVVNPEQIMIWGQSKDLGICKARRKNGEPCTAFVNKSLCTFCIYHVKQEYRKFTGRSELQAASGGSLSNLRNKVLGKNEVFYAGKSFTAVQGKPSQKQKVKDQKRLTDLFNSCESRLEPTSLQSKKHTSQPQSARVKLIKDAERLQKLTGSPATLTDLQLGSQSSKASLTNTPSNSSSKISFKNSSKQSPNQPHSTEDLSSCKTDKNNSEMRFEKMIKQTEVLNKPSITKSSRIAHSGAQSSKSLKRIGSQESYQTLTNKLPITNKQVPTKNRFNNLAKLKSLCGNSSDLKKESCSKEIQSEENKFTTNKKDDKFTCSSNILKGIDMFDVSFDFDVENNSKANKNTDFNIEENSKPSANISKSCKIKYSQDSTFSLSKHSFLKSEQSCDISLNSDDLRSDGADLSLRTNRGLSSSTNHLTPQLDSSPSVKSPLTKPLSEIKLPMNTVCQENNGEKDSNLKKIIQQIEKNKSSKDVSLSPEIPLKKLKDVVHTNSPKLSDFGNLSLTVPVRQSSAKAKAIKYVRQKGPIKREDKKTGKYKEFAVRKKRMREEEGENSKAKETELSKRFAELINATSSHTDLISQAEDEAMDEYYEKMEKKEKMEEKMLSTYKVDCKAYRCLKCKYKWFAPSDLCKSEGHPLKVVSAVKRFFQCHNCKNRTVSLDMIPLHNCKQCGQANWDRAPMMRERKMATTHLSIRGGEQKFYNSVVTDTNLDLVVPDD